MHSMQVKDNQCAQFSVQCYCKLRHKVARITKCLFSEPSSVLCKRVFAKWDA